jgi:hypothetical protein
MRSFRTHPFWLLDFNACYTLESQKLGAQLSTGPHALERLDGIVEADKSQQADLALPAIPERLSSIARFYQRVIHTRSAI